MSIPLAEATTAVSDKYEGLIWADYVSLSVYFALMLLMGLYFLRRQKNTEEYFVGGRKMNWFMVKKGGNETSYSKSSNSPNTET